MKDRKNIKVLLAEDETLSAEGIRDVLTRCGYTVVGDAMDGYEALALAISLRPDVVLMDIDMPGMNGIEATRKLQEVMPTPVVILSAHQSQDLIEQTKEAGAGAYALKPPDAMELDRSIQIAIKRHKEFMAERRLNMRLTKEITAHEILLASTLEAIQDYVYMVDAELQVVTSNRKTINETDSPSHCYRIYMNRETACEPCTAKTVFSTGKMVETEVENPVIGKIFNIRAVPVQDAEGNIVNVVLHMRDVTEQRTARKRIRELLKQLMETQEKERLMIANELHDSVAQDLAAAKLSCRLLTSHCPGLPLDAENKIRDLSRTLEKTITNIRSMAYEMRPPGLKDLGFVESVHSFCRDFSEKTGIKVNIQATGLINVSFNNLYMISLYRLIQEAFNNIRRHACADRIMLHMVMVHPHLIIRIRDNGIGFKVETRVKEAVSEKRMGLLSMQERAQMLDGDCQIQSRQGKGTKITVTIPVSAVLNGG